MASALAAHLGPSGRHVTSVARGDTIGLTNPHPVTTSRASPAANASALLGRIFAAHHAAFAEFLQVALPGNLPASEATPQAPMSAAASSATATNVASTSSATAAPAKVVSKSKVLPPLTAAMVEAHELAVFSNKLRARVRSKYQAACPAHIRIDWRSEVDLDWEEQLAAPLTHVAFSSESASEPVLPLPASVLGVHPQSPLRKLAVYGADARYVHTVYTMLVQQRQQIHDLELQRRELLHTSWFALNVPHLAHPRPRLPPTQAWAEVGLTATPKELAELQAASTRTELVTALATAAHTNLNLALAVSDDFRRQNPHLFERIRRLRPVKASPLARPLHASRVATASSALKASASLSALGVRVGSPAHSRPTSPKGVGVAFATSPPPAAAAAAAASHPVGSYATLPTYAAPSRAVEVAHDVLACVAAEPSPHPANHPIHASAAVTAAWLAEAQAPHISPIRSDSNGHSRSSATNAFAARATVTPRATSAPVRRSRGSGPVSAPPASRPTSVASSQAASKASVEGAVPELALRAVNELAATTAQAKASHTAYREIVATQIQARLAAESEVERLTEKVNGLARRRAAERVAAAAMTSPAGLSPSRLRASTPTPHVCDGHHAAHPLPAAAPRLKKSKSTPAVAPNLPYHQTESIRRLSAGSASSTKTRSRSGT